MRGNDSCLICYFGQSIVMKLIQPSLVDSSFICIDSVFHPVYELGKSKPWLIKDKLEFG